MGLHWLLPHAFKSKSWRQLVTSCTTSVQLTVSGPRTEMRCTMRKTLCGQQHCMTSHLKPQTYLSLLDDLCNSMWCGSGPIRGSIQLNLDLKIKSPRNFARANSDQEEAAWPHLWPGQGTAEPRDYRSGTRY